MVATLPNSATLVYPRVLRWIRQWAVKNPSITPEQLLLTEHWENYADNDPAPAINLTFLDEMFALAKGANPSEIEVKNNEYLMGLLPR